MIENLVRLWRFKDGVLLCRTVSVYGEGRDSSWHVRELESLGWSKERPVVHAMIIRHVRE